MQPIGKMCLYLCFCNCKKCKIQTIYYSFQLRWTLEVVKHQQLLILFCTNYAVRSVLQKIKHCRIHVHQFQIKTEHIFSNTYWTFHLKVLRKGCKTCKKQCNTILQKLMRINHNCAIYTFNYEKQIWSGSISPRELKNKIHSILSDPVLSYPPGHQNIQICLITVK